MPVSKSERKRLAEEHLQKYFPGIHTQHAKAVIEYVSRQFKENHSPIASEQTISHGSGTGVSFEHFVIGIGLEISREKPIGVSEELLSNILIGMSM